MTEFNRRKIRNGVQQWALSILNNPDVIYLDTETSDLPIKDNYDPVEVIQLGIIDNYENVLLDVLTRPTRPLSLEASRINKLNWNHVRNSPLYFKDILPIVYKLLDNKHIMAYNVEFDIGSIKHEFYRGGYRVPNFSYECAMLKYAKFNGIWDSRRDDWKWQKMPNLLGLDAHTAINDARLVKALIEFMANFNEDNDELNLNF